MKASSIAVGIKMKYASVSSVSIETFEGEKRKKSERSIQKGLGISVTLCGDRNLLFGWHIIAFIKTRILEQSSLPLPTSTVNGCVLDS
jgi:hypothetical protein